MNEKQKEELLFEIRNRIINIESVVIATAKYLAHIKDLLAEILAETNAHEMLLKQLVNKE